MTPSPSALPDPGAAGSGEQPCAKIGIACDLHIGAPGAYRWHNRLLHHRSTAICRSAVACLNSLDVDLVLVLGDVTESGEPGQLAQASEILGELVAPWYVIPGNHDGPGVRSGAWEMAFRGHVPQLYCQWGNAGALFVPETLDDRLPPPDNYALAPSMVDAAVETVAANRPATLLVFSHVNLVPDQAHADWHRGPYAGHHAHGLALVERLESLVSQRILLLCGHQHWHHVTEGRNWIQCASGSLIEYPMEVRTVLIADEAVQLTVYPGVAEAIALASLESAPWVSGVEGDRNVILSLRRPTGAGPK